MQSKSKGQYLCPLLKIGAWLFDHVARQRHMFGPMNRIQGQVFSGSDWLTGMMHLTVIQVTKVFRIGMLWF